MMKNGVVLLLVIVFAFTGCGDDEKEYGLNIKLEYGGEPLVMYEPLEYPTGQSIEITRFSFFVSGISFSGNDFLQSDGIPAYLDLTEAHADLEKARQGYEYKILSSEEDYSTLSFNIGLTPEQNATVPQDYPSSNVLSNTAEYWTGWESYIMLKIEGMIDLDGDGELEKGIALHLGTDEVTRGFFCDISGGKTDMIIDVKNIFECNGEVHDIVSTRTIHNLSKLPEAIKLVDNFSCALRFD